MPKVKESDIVIFTKNDEMSSVEQRARSLINGAKPISKSEKKLVKQIKEIEKRGHIIDIPPSL